MTGDEINALERIRAWADAYPIDVFPEPDWNKSALALSKVGLSLDQISAANMRHVITQVKEIADDGIRVARKDDEINALARKIADEAAWADIECGVRRLLSNGCWDVGDLDPDYADWVSRAVTYLDARGLLERPDPTNPNIVRLRQP